MMEIREKLLYVKHQLVEAVDLGAGYPVAALDDAIKKIEEAMDSLELVFEVYRLAKERDDVLRKLVKKYELDNIIEVRHLGRLSSDLSDEISRVIRRGK